MARPKEFDPDHAVDAAMRTFWRDGYEGTSVDDLTRACGISRGSMYATFGSKDALYVKALDHYTATAGEIALGCLAGDGTARDRIARLFRHFADDTLGDPENRGCFMLNAAMERAGHDAVVARRVRDAIGENEAALLGLLQDAQDAGELAADRDPKALARYLVAALNGVRVTAKATRDRALIDDAIAIALEALGPPPATGS